MTDKTLTCLVREVEKGDRIAIGGVEQIVRSAPQVGVVEGFAMIQLEGHDGAEYLRLASDAVVTVRRRRDLEAEKAERVAKAMFADWYGKENTWAELGKGDRDKWVKNAKAAIAAVKELEVAE